MYPTRCARTVFPAMRQALTHLKRRDPVLREVIAAAGPYRIVYREPDFDTLVRSIVYQQVSGKAAVAVYRKLAAKAGAPVTAERIARLRTPSLRAAGLSGQKVSYLRDLARRTLRGELDLSRLSSLPDEEVIRQLTEVRGIGVWTAQMFLIFALRRPDVLPVTDLGIRTAMKQLYGLSELPKPPAMHEIAARWVPYRSVASWYLWRMLDGPATL
jgi:DNA-3-methyladenine glycosylase II